MSISPKYIGQTLGHGPIVIDLFLDYVCPFSRILYATLYTKVFPGIAKEYPNKFQFVFRHQLQPWHPSSTLVHEAAIAVSKLAPAKFWDFSYALFENSESFYDEVVYRESRHDTYQRLATLAETSVGVDRTKFLELLSIPDNNPPTNCSNKLQADVKYFIKFGRQNGIHVSPTVAINGLIDTDISSSFTDKQWAEKLLQLLE